MKSLFFFLSCLSCLAQFPYSGTTWSKPSSAQAAPLAVGGLQYWWVSSDLTNNWTVTNWVDRVSGAILTNGANSLRPTNSTLGVGFSGSTYLTNWNVTVSNKTTLVMLWRPFDTNNTGSEAVVLGDPGDNTRYRLIGNGLFGLQNQGIYYPSTNDMVDMYLTVKDPTVGTINANTNNVLIGNVGSGPTAGTIFGALGGSDVALHHAKFQVLELLWYTNNILTNSTTLTTLHNYFTNTYAPLITIKP